MDKIPIFVFDASFFCLKLINLSLHNLKFIFMMISFSTMEILMNYLFLHIYVHIFLALCIDKNIFSLVKDIP